MDLGVSDMARPSINNVKQRIVLYALRSDTQGVDSMMEFVFLMAAFAVIIAWLVVGGEGED